MPRRTRSKSAANGNRRVYKGMRTTQARDVSAIQPANSIYVSGVPRPLGRSIRTNHTYFERQVTLSPSLGVPGIYVYSANGMFDPNITGGGNQPLGFDQMTPMFDHYSVIYSKITVDFYYTGTSESAYVGVKLTDNSGSVTSPAPLACGESTGALVTDQKDSITISRSVNIGKFLGRPNVLNEDDLRGTSSSNPTEQAYWFLYNIPNGSANNDVVAIVRIEYVAIWTEPKALDLS